MINRLTKEGYLIVVLGWIIMILSGTTPYFISESISGFSNIFLKPHLATATGATIINDVTLWNFILEKYHTLAWGMGMIVFAIAILPLLGIGVCSYLALNHLVQILINYTRITDTAKRLWLIYVSFTFIETIFLN